MGQGDGIGEGAGEDTATNVAAGSGVAICLVICFYCVGIPVLFVGAAFLALFVSGTTLWNVGLACIIISVLFIIAGIVAVIAVCTGCFGKANNQVGHGGAVHSDGNTIVMSQQSGQMQQPPPYTSGQPPVYGPPPVYSQPPVYNQPQGQPMTDNQPGQAGGAPY